MMYFSQNVVPLQYSHWQHGSEDQINLSPFPYSVPGYLFLSGFVLGSFRVMSMTLANLLAVSVYLKLVIWASFCANILTEDFPLL